MAMREFSKFRVALFVLGLFILPMLLGTAFFFEDDGNGCEDQNDQSNIKEPLQSNPEENSDLILLDRDNTRYSRSDAAAAVRSNNLDNIIRAGGGDDRVVAEGVDNWVLDNCGSNQVMGDVGNDTLVAVDGNNAVDQKRIRS